MPFLMLLASDLTTAGRTRIAPEAPSPCSHRRVGDIEPKVRAVCRCRTGIIKPGYGFVR